MTKASLKKDKQKDNVSDDYQIKSHSAMNVAVNQAFGGCKIKIFLGAARLGLLCPS